MRAIVASDTNNFRWRNGCKQVRLAKRQVSDTLGGNIIERLCLLRRRNERPGDLFAACNQFNQAVVRDFVQQESAIFHVKAILARQRTINSDERETSRTRDSLRRAQ